MYGSISEYVFDEGSKASELNWELKPLLLAGTKLSGTLYNVKIEGSLFYAINEDTGSIKDYDWDTSTGKMTNYSKHDIKQRGSIFSDVNVAYIYHIINGLSLFPGAGIKYNNIQLTAEDGYLEYPPGSAQKNVYGKGIIYEQKYYIPYAGAGIQYEWNQFCLSVSFYYSQFVQCNARDSHLKREIDFYDGIKRTKYYCFKGDTSYRFTERTSISIGAGWSYIPLSKGNSYYIDLSTGEQSPRFKNGGGIKAEYFDAVLAVNLYL